MRTDEQDKNIISDEAFKAEQSLTTLRALVKFALFQIENASEEEFVSFRDDWDVMLRLMQEKLSSAYENNAEIGYLAATCSIEPEARH